MIKKFTFLLFLVLTILSCKTVEVKETSEKKDSDTKPTIKKENISVKDNTDDTLIKNVVIEDDRFNFIIDEKTSKNDLDSRIRRLFEAIEEKIATGDFDGWYSALSYKNKKYISDKSILLNMSKESDYLYSRKITLQSPKDYFLHIVMPSRKGYTLKYVNYEYIDKNHIKVDCVLDDTVKFVYDFVYEDGSWKVDRK